MYDYLQDLFAGGALTFEEFSGKLEKADGIKLVNLKDGGYVGRDKFDALAAERDGLKGQLAQRRVSVRKRGTRAGNRAPRYAAAAQNQRAGTNGRLLCQQPILSKKVKENLYGHPIQFPQRG